jgi:hypothetical protein
LELTVAGIDYDKFMADSTAKAEMTALLKQETLSHVNPLLGSQKLTEEHIAISYSSGSLKATVSITKPEGTSAGNFETVVTDSTSEIAEKTAIKAKTITGVDTVMEAGKSKTDIAITALVVTTTTTAAPSGGGTETTAAAAEKFLVVTMGAFAVSMMLSV